VTVVEDSWAGVAAAVAAGCFTVAVDRGAGLHDLDHADLVVQRLTVQALRRPG
ncbi:MAG: phosphatase, partial [Actinobacteria bacterium]|nr:phosphatase [Actinomycetota bacterium]NIU69559.1 phosphatase [Actinomycetota bacterium]NIW31426.1 phosphatase [Actinomycetota bacterium]NIX23768.1 phosphatase [Actinomycetota bacterium]